MRVIGWIVYAAVGALLTFVALIAGHPWFSLALALCFIFGPKIWKNL